MAHCFGESGCWKEILSQLKEINISATFLEEIPHLIYTLERKLHEEQIIAEHQYHEQYLFLNELLEKTQLSSQQEIETQTLKTNQQIALYEQNIHQNQSIIYQITKEEEQQLFSLVMPLTVQLNELNCSIDILDNKVNKLNVLLNQNITLLSQEKKPAWYNLFAYIKRYFYIKKQSAILTKDYQLSVNPFKLQLIDLTKKRDSILKEKYLLQQQYEHRLESNLAPVHQKINEHSLKKQQAIKALEYIIKTQHLNIEKHQKDLDAFKQHKPLFIKEKTRTTCHQLERLKIIRESSEYKGAIAELEMIDLLKKLPDNYFVFSDVKLDSYQYHCYQGKPLKSAQIDHLIVCLKGIFIIEVKNWSKKFAENNDAQNPYEQVERASTLCYFLLKDDFKNVKTKAILAYKGSIPPKSSSFRGKLLSMSYVNQYVTGSYFQNIFTSSQLHDLVNYFKSKEKHNETKTESYLRFW
jgi:hypothetical protein